MNPSTFHIIHQFQSGIELQGTFKVVGPLTLPLEEASRRFVPDHIAHRAILKLPIGKSIEENTTTTHEGKHERTSKNELTLSL